MNKKTTFNVILTLIMAYTLFILISTAISTSKWYNACKDFYMELKYPTPRVKIENYNDLVNSDIINKDGVKRVNLDWTLFGTTLNPLPGIPIPQGYELIVTTDNSILISDDYHSNIIPENEMIDFLLNTFLPSDAKFISHKAYFKKRHKFR